MAPRIDTAYAPTVAKDADHIGAIGESALQLWCHEAEITPNRVQFDKKGWDYFLQFPAPSAVSCLVQVKTTQSGAKRVSVSLRNWRHLCSVPMPAFFLVITLDKRSKPVRGHLVHVDEAHARSVAARAGDGSLDLRWGESDRLRALTGEALRLAIEWHVTPDTLSYVKRKLEWTIRPNEPERLFSITVKLRRDDPDAVAEAMADIAIGTRMSIDTVHVEVNRLIDGRKQPVKRMRRATFTVPKPPSFGITKVRLRNARTGQEVVLEAETFIAERVFPNLPEKFRKVRFVAGPVSFVMAPSKTDANLVTLHWHFNLPSEGGLKLSDAIAPARALRLLASPLDEELRLAVDDMPTDIALARGERVQSEDVRRYANTIVAAWTIATAFSLPASLEVDVQTLLNEAERIALLAAPFADGPHDAEVGVTVAQGLRERNPSAVGILMNPSTRLGDYVVTGIIAVVGRPTWAASGTRARLTIKDPHPKLMVRRMVRVKAWSRFDPMPMYDEAEASLSRDGVLCLRPDAIATTRKPAATRKGKRREKPRSQ